MSLSSFFDEDESDKITKEKQRRICVSLWALAYEKHASSPVSDAKFDKTCLEINPEIETGNKKLDKFFKEKFHPHTGQWVHEHPELDKIEALYQRLDAQGFFAKKINEMLKGI